MSNHATKFAVSQTLRDNKGRCFHWGKKVLLILGCGNEKRKENEIELVVVVIREQSNIINI